MVQGNINQTLYDKFQGFKDISSPAVPSFIKHMAQYAQYDIFRIATKTAQLCLADMSDKPGKPVGAGGKWKAAAGNSTC